MNQHADPQAKTLRANFRRIERREWWLWASGFVITLLLTVALASFLLPGASFIQDFNSQHMLSQAMRGLVGLVFLFDLYTIYQHLLIHRMRRELVEREELFHLISENAADMIAVVDTHGKRLFNSLSYRKVLGYSPEELQASSAFEQIHQLQAALQQIEQSYEHTLQALGAAIDLRDNETGGHSQRVCRYSLEIARALGWQEKQLGTLARGAYLHDIGKLGVPDGILLKPGKLTPDERKIMQRHAQIGFDLVKDIPFLADATDVVLMHHERFDGTGYPQGLKGEQIPVSARIFAIADTLDAITSERPYQRASSCESAREIIRRLSGTAFDPQIVNVFLNIREDVWPTIASNQRRVAGLSSEQRRNPSMLRIGLGLIPD